MSKPWKMSQPMMLPGVELDGTARDEHLVALGVLPDALEVEDAQWVSGAVMSPARMHPQNTSWCATHRGVERCLMNRWASRLFAEPGSATAERPRPPRNASQPRRLEHRGRWSTQPDRVAVQDAEHGEHQPVQVADQHGVEPEQSVAADERQRQEDGHADDAPADPRRSTLDGGVGAPRKLAAMRIHCDEFSQRRQEYPVAPPRDTPFSSLDRGVDAADGGWRR